MFVLHCPTCARNYLVGRRSIETTPAADGQPATMLATCPSGHVHEVRMRGGRLVPVEVLAA
ncbi:MAG: hypothetical protein AAFZ07_21660 [Actinomycetota bacterium]